VLLVTRKVGQRILIGENIAVTLVKISGGGVRIGIDAPAEMPVIREELAKEVRGKRSGGRSLKSDKACSDL
jgi:carbon storage regulator